MLAITSPTFAVMGGDKSEREVPNDPDYTAGIDAFKRKDWQGVIDHMSRLIERKPWDDNAHNLVGFAYRKLGDYRRSLEHYQQALDLNPHHRGALEYLGETYLAMGCVAQAHETFTRLATACRRVKGVTAKGDWQSDCEAWRELRTEIEAYRGQPRPTCALD